MPPLARVVLVVALWVGWQLVTHDGHLVEVRNQEGDVLMYVDLTGKWVLNARCPTPVAAPAAEQLAAARTDARQASFAMRVKGVSGGGKGCLPDGTLGEIPGFALNGDLESGSPPIEGSEIVLARMGQPPLRVRVDQVIAQPNGALLLRTNEGRMRDVVGVYAAASDEALLNTIATPSPVPGAPTAADEYADYRGPAVRYTQQPSDGVDFEIRVRLERVPTPDEAASLQRAIRAWDNVGTLDGFGKDLFGTAPGYLHGLYSDEDFGPRWRGDMLRWLEDFGSADERLAMDDLARRLGGWSAAHGIRIVELNFGQ